MGRQLVHKSAGLPGLGTGVIIAFLVVLLFTWRTARTAAVCCFWDYDPMASELNILSS